MPTKYCSLCGSGNPRHPGELLYTQYIKRRGITIDAAARHIGVTRQTLSNLVNGRSSMSIAMALALSREFGKTAEEWLNLQVTWDLWHVRQDTAGLTDLSNASHTG